MAKMEIKRILSDTISALSKSSLTYKEEIKIEGLIGITIDKTEIILININECFASSSPKTPTKEPSKSKLNEEVVKEKSSKSVDTNSNENTSSNSSKPPNHKVLSETSHKECVQADESGYTEVQKSIKRVQRPEGLVEQKEVEWKKFTLDGELLEQRKMEEVQPLEEPNYEEDHDGNEGASSAFDTNNEEIYEDGFCEDEYDNNNGYSDTYSHQSHQFSRPFNRGFPSPANNRGTKRQMPHRNMQQPFVKRMRPEQQTSQSRGRKSQFQHFPYTKVVLQKPDTPRMTRKGTATSSTSRGNKTKSNVQPNDVIFNNALNLVWQGKMTVNAAIEMFNLPEILFKKELTLNKLRSAKAAPRGGRGKGKASSGLNVAGDRASWDWEEEGEYDDDPNYED